jgi:hypothetical protein
MAFGKDDAHLPTIGGYGASTFGQQAGQAAQRGPRGGRGNSAYWRGSFDISENPGTPDTFRIIRGAYRQQLVNRENVLYEDTLPYFYFREHFHGATNKGAICSAGPYYMDRKQRQPCEGCEMHWEDYTERQAKKNRGDNTRGPNRISMTDKFAFTVWDYGVYFEMPDVDRNGQFRMNPHTNQPYTSWVKAYNVHDPQFAGRPWKLGDLRPWAVGKTWRDTLVNQSDFVIGNSCLSCGAQGSMYSRGWYCGNPQCRQLIFDPNNTTMSPDEQVAKRKNPFECRACGHTLFPHEEVGCRNCANGRRASIFDVDLVGFRQRSGDGNQTNLTIISFVGPCALRIQDPKVLETVKPLDLTKWYASTPVDKQREIWNIQHSTAGQMQLPLQGMPPSQLQPYPPPPNNMQQQAYQPPAQPPQWAPPPPQALPAQAYPPIAPPMAMPAPQMQVPTMGGAAVFPPRPPSASPDWVAQLAEMNKRLGQ